MDFDEKTDVINQIISGYYILDHFGDIYYLKDPDIEIVAEGIVKKKQFRAEAKKNGFITRDQEKQLLAREHIWLDNDEIAYEKTRDTLSNLRGELKRYEFQSIKLAELKTLIEINEQKLKKMWSAKSSFYTQTIDYQVDYQYYCWLLSKCLYRPDNTLVWETYDDLEEDQDDRLLKYCVNLLFGDGLFNEKQIRELARSEPWRTMWKSADKTAQIHSLSPIRMLYMLCYWSNIYDAVYESTDDLTTEQIADDDFINQWLIEKSNSRNGAKNKNYTENAKIKNAQEVFVKADSFDDAQKVYNTMNDNEGRNRLRSRQRLIMERGKVKETEMPDTQNFLKMVMNQAATAAIKNSTKR